MKSHHHHHQQDQQQQQQHHDGDAPLTHSSSSGSSTTTAAVPALQLVLFIFAAALISFAAWLLSSVADTPFIEFQNVPRSDSFGRYNGTVAVSLTSQRVCPSTCTAPGCIYFQCYEIEPCSPLDVLSASQSSSLCTAGDVACVASIIGALSGYGTILLILFFLSKAVQQQQSAVQVSKLRKLSLAIVGATAVFAIGCLLPLAAIIALVSPASSSSLAAVPNAHTRGGGLFSFVTAFAAAALALLAVTLGRRKAFAPFVAAIEAAAAKSPSSSAPAPAPLPKTETALFTNCLVPCTGLLFIPLVLLLSPFASVSNIPTLATDGPFAGQMVNVSASLTFGDTRICPSAPCDASSPTCAAFQCYTTSACPNFGGLPADANARLCAILKTTRVAAWAAVAVAAFAHVAPFVLVVRSSSLLYAAAAVASATAKSTTDQPPDPAPTPGRVAAHLAAVAKDPRKRLRAALRAARAATAAAAVATLASVAAVVVAARATAAARDVAPMLRIYLSTEPVTALVVVAVAALAAFAVAARRIVAAATAAVEVIERAALVGDEVVQEVKSAGDESAFQRPDKRATATKSTLLASSLTGPYAVTSPAAIQSTPASVRHQAVLEDAPCCRRGGSEKEEG
ncbi:hypothetical protein DFJ73DRAFT_955780 [Zopfochytrium polystomum]|nr:hypothetical protein DFJ73DRAFT_955780 [Zopfochytrium polystomum]